MNKIKILSLLICFSSVYVSQAQNNIFSPKQDSVTEKELNEVVQEKLNEQKLSLETNFRSDIENLKMEQQNQINSILSKLEELQQQKIDNVSKPIPNNNLLPDIIISEDDSLNDKNEELKQILEKNDIGVDSFIVADELMKLNSEFGIEGLTFIGIIDDHKLYKNSMGEYIVKPLDFDYQDYMKKSKEAASN